MAQNIAKLNKTLDSLGLYKNDDDNESAGAAAAPEAAGVKKAKQQGKRNASQAQRQPGSLVLEVDKLMKEKLHRLLKHSIDGHLDTLIATVESGQPDYDKVESVAPHIAGSPTRKSEAQTLKAGPPGTP